MQGIIAGVPLEERDHHAKTRADGPQLNHLHAVVARHGPSPHET